MEHYDSHRELNLFLLTFSASYISYYKIHALK